MSNGWHDKPRLRIMELDGSPDGRPITLKVSNGSLTNNGDGTFTLVTGGGTPFIESVSDTNTIDLVVTGTDLTANLRYADSSTINFSDSGAGFTGITIQQMSITADASGLKLVNDEASPGNSEYYGTNGAGTKGFFALPSATPGGSDTQVQFNDAGSFGGDADFTWDKTTNILTVAGTGVFNDVRITNTLTLEETGAGTDVITIQAPASIAAPYSLTLPVDDGLLNQVLTTNGSGVLSWSTSTTGTVTGTGTDNHVVRWDGTGVPVIQDSVVIIADTTGDISATGNITGGTAGGITVTGGTGAGDTLTLTSTTNGVKGSIIATNRLLIFDGVSDAALGLAFSADTDNGFWREAADTWTMVTGAVPVWTSRTSVFTFNPDQADQDFVMESVNDGSGNFRSDASTDSITIGVGEGPSATANTKMEILVGDLNPDYNPLKINHVPTTDYAGTISTSQNIFFSFELTTGSKSLGNNRLQQTAQYESSGGTLTLAHAIHGMNLTLLETSGTLTKTNFYLQQANVDTGGGDVENWSVLWGGAHRNHYNGVAAVALGAGVPDAWIVAFGAYALPDANYTIQGTGGWTTYIVTDKFKGIVGTGWIHAKAVVDWSTKATTGFTGYIEYQAIDGGIGLVPGASWAGSQWNNQAVMLGPAGIAAHYVGGAITILGDGDLSFVDWAVRRWL